MVKQEELFNTYDGPIYRVMNKYTEDSSLQLTVEDTKMVTRGCKTLQQLSRKISQFRIEHKVFKQFRFRDHEHH